MIFNVECFLDIIRPNSKTIYLFALICRIALKHGLLRGWFSYTDLTNILAQMHYLEAVKNAIQKTFQVHIYESQFYCELFHLSRCDGIFLW